MTFADVVVKLRQFDEPPVDGQAPAIFVAEPWNSFSEATVAWCGAKGGVPLKKKPVLSIYSTSHLRSALLR